MKKVFLLFILFFSAFIFICNGQRLVFEKPLFNDTLSRPFFIDISDDGGLGIASNSYTSCKNSYFGLLDSNDSFSLVQIESEGVFINASLVDTLVQLLKYTEYSSCGDVSSTFSNSNYSTFGQLRKTNLDNTQYIYNTNGFYIFHEYLYVGSGKNTAAVLSERGVLLNLTWDPQGGSVHRSAGIMKFKDNKAKGLKVLELEDVIYYFVYSSTELAIFTDQGKYDRLIEFNQIQHVEQAGNTLLILADNKLIRMDHQLDMIESWPLTIAPNSIIKFKDDQLQILEDIDQQIRWSVFDLTNGIHTQQYLFDFPIMQLHDFRWDDSTLYIVGHYQSQGALQVYDLTKIEPLISPRTDVELENAYQTIYETTGEIFYVFEVFNHSLDTLNGLTLIYEPSHSFDCFFIKVQLELDDQLLPSQKSTLVVSEKDMKNEFTDLLQPNLGASITLVAPGDKIDMDISNNTAILINGVLSQEDIHSTNFHLQTFPNPVSTGEMVYIDDSIQFDSWSLRDAQGRIIINGKKDNNTFQAPNLPGLYLLEAYSGSKMYRSKLFVIK
jgi:hypothetical protein